METAVTRTDDDALAARASAAKLGYFDDPYLKYFVKSVIRKAPVINRGTYVRTTAINSHIGDFLSRGGRQIISLGAGSDTRAFKIAKDYINQGRSINFVWHEVDFPGVTQRKALTLASKRGLKDLIGEVKVDTNRGCIEQGWYRLWPMDLVQSLSIDVFDQSLETLVLSEVCLCYLPVKSTREVLERLSFASTILIYEPIGGHDAFGQMMIKNLAQRGLIIPTLLEFVDLEAQRNRLVKLGYNKTQALTMRTAFDNLSESEKERISKLEMFDEVEEWFMMADHYCIVVGQK